MTKSMPASSAHLVAFLHPYYADRINLEANSSALDDLTSETELDWNGSAKTAPPELDARTRTAMPAGTVSVGKKPARGPTLAAVAAAAAVVAVTGLAWYTLGREAPVIPPPTIAQVDSVVPLVAVESAKLNFSIVSEPPGSDVELAGKRVGSTPLELAYRKTELPLQVRVLREGFEPMHFNLTATSERQLSAQLVKRKVKPMVSKPPDIKINR